MKTVFLSVLAMFVIMACNLNSKKTSNSQEIADSSLSESFDESSEADPLPVIPEDFDLSGDYDEDGGVIVIESSSTMEESDLMSYELVEVKPLFQGGDMGSFRNWVAKNLKYPEDANADEIEGRVIVRFVIDTEGDVTKAEVVRGINYSLDHEALRVVRSSPKWTPGSYKGEPVEVAIVLPVVFQLK